MCHYLFFAVLAARLKLALVGAPLAPGFLIFSPEPAAMRFLLAWMFAYNPLLASHYLYPFFPPLPFEPHEPLPLCAIISSPDSFFSLHPLAFSAQQEAFFSYSLLVDQ